MNQQVWHFGRRLTAALLVLLGICSAANAQDAAPGAAPGDFPAKVPAQVQKSGQPQAALPRLSPAFKVEVYSHVAQPMKLSFGPDGALYVGRQGGNDVIHRVAPGGQPVSEFGPPMRDPDAVLVDTAGLISGVPAAVLVGGGGTLAAIFQDQTRRSSSIRALPTSMT